MGSSLFTRGINLNETDLLKEELEHYRTEKENVRRIVGQIGGKASTRADKPVNIAFILLVFSLFAFDLVRHFVGIELTSVPERIFLELAVLLVSVKIIWMIHKQTKVEHFQFWILNSIEFRMNSMAIRIREIEALLQRIERGGE